MENIKDKVIMIQLGQFRNSSIDEEYWEKLGFPIVKSQEELDNYDWKNYKTIYVTIYSHSGISYRVQKNDYKLQPWDEVLGYKFFVNTQDEEIFDEFADKLHNYFKDLECATEEYGFEFDDYLFWDDIENDLGAREIIVADMKIKHYELPEDLTIGEIDGYIENKIDKAIESRDEDFKNRYFDKMHDYHNALRSELYWSGADETITFKESFGEIIDKLNEEQTNVKRGQ